MYNSDEVFRRPLSLGDIGVDGRSPDKSCRRIERAVKSRLAETVHPTIYTTLRDIRATHHGGREYQVEIEYEEYDGTNRTVQVEDIDFT